MSDNSPDALLEHARALLARAYAPYSGFAVAAVVLDAQGRRHGGVNVENASYGLTLCAERAAIAAAIAAGAGPLVALAVVAARASPVMPCGACRQVIAEFLPPDAPVHAQGPGGAVLTWTVAQLLPAAFGAGDLGAAAARPPS